MKTTVQSFGNCLYLLVRFDNGTQGNRNSLTQKVFHLQFRYAQTL